MGRRHRGYGQFCPLAKAAEILSERWTLLVLRELVAGSRRFGELRRGIPLISPGMLAQRLRQLEDARVIARRTERQRPDGPAAVAYELTAAGEELGPVLEHLGVWGQRWAVSDLRREDLDPAYVMWALHRTVRVEPLPAARTVIAFQILDAPHATRHWWLVIDGGQPTLCLTNPGMTVDLTVVSKVRPLALLSLGRLAPALAIRSGEVTLQGAAALARGFRSWWPEQQPAAPDRRAPAARRGASA
jgi:DNA-binding HxlR family transcriptional regulator